MGCGSSSAAVGSSLPTATAGVAASSTTTNDARPRTERTQTVLGHARGRSELRAFDQRVCILVSDMSGFTKQTRQHGIIHFGSKILRMRQMVHGIIKRHAPLVVETEADNFLLLFHDVRDGVQCALDMMAATKAYNRRCTDKKMRIEFGGIGLDFGDVTLEAPSGHFYGKAADGAFLLGEDVANGDILLTRRVKDELKSSFPDVYDTLKFERKDDPELEFDHLEKHYYILTARPPKHKHAYGQSKAEGKKAEEEERKAEYARQNQLWSFYWNDVNDASYIGEECTLLTRRHEFDIEPLALKALDVEIAAKYLSPEDRDIVVIMFGLHTGKITEKQGITQAFKLKHIVLELLQPIIEDHGGRCIEDCFLIFEHEAEAVACAIDMAACIAHYNEGVPDSQHVEPKGFGIHSGPLLVVPNTNVHWGDAVSTASKLGEDLGLPGEILVSDKVWSKCKDLPVFAQLVSQMKDLETSGVQFQAASLSGTYERADLPKVVHSYMTPSTQTGAAQANPVDDAPATPLDLQATPVTRTMSLGQRHSTVNVLDVRRNPARRTSDRGSMFVLPTDESGAVQVTTGVLGRNLSRKLLLGSGSSAEATETSVPPIAIDRASSLMSSPAARMSARQQSHHSKEDEKERKEKRSSRRATNEGDPSLLRVGSLPTTSGEKPTLSPLNSIATTVTSSPAETPKLKTKGLGITIKSSFALATTESNDASEDAAAPALSVDPTSSTSGLASLTGTGSITNGSPKARLVLAPLSRPKSNLILTSSLPNKNALATPPLQPLTQAQSPPPPPESADLSL